MAEYSDYRSIKEYKSSSEAQKDRERIPLDAVHWWSEQEPEVRARLFISHCQGLKADSTRREAANVRHARLYENVEVNSLTGVDYATATVRQAILGTGVVTLNVVAACEDTLAAKIAKNKPRPMFLTSGASWKKQMQARRLDKWNRGLFYKLKVYEEAKSVWYDAMTFGTGFYFLTADPDNPGKLWGERVLPSEMFVDDSDGKYGTPRQIVRRRIVPREVAVATWPEHADHIYAAKPPADEQLSNQARSPMVEVFDGWHLPSRQGADDGCHIVAIQGCQLSYEPWVIDQFPFCTLRFKKRIVGFWGKGVAETLTGIQVELNRLTQSIAKQLRRKGRGRIFLEYGSKVDPNHLTNDVGDIVYFRGKPPIVDNQNAVAPEEFQQVDRLYQRAFQEVGVSELSASAKKPSGLDAAVALREYSDIESERFALSHQGWENFFIEVTTLAIKLITKQYKWGSYKVPAPGRRNFVEVDWKDINLEADDFMMQLWPVSGLPQTPAAKYERVMEMLNDQMVSKPIAQRLLDFPDIETEENLANAALDDADATISAILDEEEPKYETLQVYQNIQLILERATAWYLYARHFPDIEEKRLKLLRQLIDDASSMVAALTQPPPGAPGMAPEATGVAGAPQPPGGGASIINTNNQMAPGPVPAVPPVIA